MADHSDLAQLRDIHLPDPMGWWPLAMGWYVVAVVLGLVLFSVLFLVIRHIINGRSKRQALRVLESYLQDYLIQRNVQISSARISELLKRVALVYYPRERVASLQGQDWIDFLNQSAKHIDFNPLSVLLLDCPYHPVGEQDLLPLFHLAKLWIKQRRGRCLN